jgi:L-ascorbate metabolism protein UlaG (beta-lactamase superfamily)
MRALLLLLGVTITGCASAPPRRPLTLKWFGVSGWSLSDGQHVVLVDPYFSRPADTEHAAPDEEAIARGAPAKADLVVVGHPHIDHGLDAASVARRTGAKLLGNTETLQKGRAAGLPAEQLVGVQGGEDLAFDGFSVRVLPSLHSMIGFDNGGEATTFAYLIRLGGNEVLVLDTANFIERELDGLRPNVAIIATGLRSKVRDYSCRLMHALGRQPLLLATHFDEWKKPVDTPLSEQTQADLAAFTAEIHACAPDTQVVIPRAFSATVH